MICSAPKAVTLLAAALLLGLAGLAPAHAQTGNLYLTDDQGFGYVVQGGNLVNTFTLVNGSETVIAVAGDIRTTGPSDNFFGPTIFGGTQGAQYNLSGTPTGNLFSRDIGGIMADGTTDGQYNYGVSFIDDSGLGAVYRYDRNWTNGVQLFDTGFGAEDELGITYDASNNSLWTSGNDGFVRDWTLGGAEIGSFVPSDGAVFALALDSADGTLWLSTGVTGELSQYSKTGTLLQTETIAGLAPGGQFLGGEFAETPSAVTPEGSSLLMLGLGLLPLGYGLRKKLKKA